MWSVHPFPAIVQTHGHWGSPLSMEATRQREKSMRVHHQNDDTSDEVRSRDVSSSGELRVSFFGEIVSSLGHMDLSPSRVIRRRLSDPRGRLVTSRATHLSIKHRGRRFALELRKELFRFRCPVQLRRIQDAHPGPLLHPLAALATQVVLDRPAHMISHLSDRNYASAAGHTTADEFTSQGEIIQHMICRAEG